MKRHISLAIAFLASTTVSVTAQQVTAKPINGPNGLLVGYNVCVDNDCQLAAGPVSNGYLANVAAGYFTAKTFVETQKQTAALANILNNLLKSSQDTNGLVTQQINSFNQDLRNAINAQFANLPQELVSSPAMQKALDNLRQDILKTVDGKISALHSANPPPH